MKIVVDTSIIVEFLRTGEGVYSDLVLLAKRKSTTIYVPTVVNLELWRGLSMKNPEVEKQVEKLLQATTSLLLTKQLAKEAGTIMRENSMNDYIDSVIAASTLYLDAKLATLNKKHFTKVKGLKLFSS